MKDMYAEEGGAGIAARRETDGKPAVLLIGDSIRMGCCETVRSALADTAQVYYPEENCRHTHHVITMLRTWSALCPPETVKAVVVNCGHWDIAHWDDLDQPLTSLSQYAENMGRILNQLRKNYPYAEVILATTTPMNPNGVCGVNPRTTEEIRRYNEAAVAVAREKQVRVLDLFAFTEAWETDAYADYCHFTPEAFRRLGLHVADFLRGLLAEKE